MTQSAVPPAAWPPSIETARRIWVVGPCGGGKSSVATRIAAGRGMTPIAGDELLWLPQWTLRPLEERIELWQGATAGEAWVADGNLGAREEWLWELAPRAELFLWLDLPLRVTLPRLVARCWKRALKSEPICNGNYESLRLSFASKDSLLLYALRSDRRRRRTYEARLAGIPHLRVFSQRETDELLSRY